MILSLFSHTVITKGRHNRTWVSCRVVGRVVTLERGRAGLCCACCVLRVSVACWLLLLLLVRSVAVAVVFRLFPGRRAARLDPGALILILVHDIGSACHPSK